MKNYKYDIEDEILFVLIWRRVQAILRSFRTFGVPNLKSIYWSIFLGLGCDCGSLHGPGFSLLYNATCD